jgi:RNA polymerase sigma factor (sigma-70 family)
MARFSDKELIDKVRAREEMAFSQIYEYSFPPIAGYIVKNNGSEQDAEDIFQESIIVLLSKTARQDFVLTASVTTYLFSIARNLWLKRLRQKKQITEICDYESLDIPSDAEPESQDPGKLTGWLKKITTYCQKILKAIYYKNEPMNQLMIKMGWKNKHTASQQKYKCLQQIGKIREKEGSNQQRVG